MAGYNTDLVADIALHQAVARPHAHRNALGYLRIDLLEERVSAATDIITRSAEAHGCRLLRMVHGEPRDDPIGQLIRLVHQYDVDVVFAPSAAHFEGAIPPNLALLCDVVLVRSRRRYPRWLRAIIGGCETA
ncbi:hypothetical protein [Nocardia sp. NPDC058666]|uniref:hypothetical protein n=1 Tax=unclassified Nocardia TaxID=2637762 RepID=UPI00365968E6